MNGRWRYPLIYLITGGTAEDSDFAATSVEILSLIEAAVDNKISLVQIREKHLSARHLFELTVAAMKIARGSTTQVLVNDRPDIALAAKADGVHLAENSLPVAVVRRHFSKDLIVGVSTHSAEAVLAASLHGADIAVFGPVFETPGKGPPQGLTVLADACERSRPFPVIGLGGINESNCQSVLDAGAFGIAAIRELGDRAWIEAMVRKLDQ